MIGLGSDRKKGAKSHGLPSPLLENHDDAQVDNEEGFTDIN